MITLISPPMLEDENSSLFLGRRGTPPLSLAYLSSIIEKNSLTYNIIDAITYKERSFIEKFDINIYGLSLSKIASKLDDSTEVVGITSMYSSEWPIISMLCKEIKTRFPDVLIIVGGEHPTVDFKNILNYEPAIDICFIGESDASFDYFLKNLGSEEIYNTPGIAYRNKNREVVSNETSRITQIDHLIPSWKLIDLDYYHNNQLSSSSFNKKSMPILASRGCPYKCTFCTNVAVWGNRYVMRSPESIINEMKFYKEEYGVTHFDFLDMSMNINKSWFSSLLDIFIKEMPGITWQMEAGSRSEILDYDILKRMYESGNSIIDYAPETGSKSLAKKIEKRLNFDKFFKSVQTAISLNYLVKSNFIIGLPGETKLDLIKTIFTALRLGSMGARGVVVFLYSPMIGTPLSKGQGLYENETKEEYDKRILDLAGITCVKIFRLKTLFTNPERELYAILANATTVSAYFLSWIRYPKNSINLYKNISKKSPQGPFEMAFFLLLTRLRILR
jgi:anaerobic magnesium-protoporphyrin IX monomethyl ester cyclase